jgi:antitoxin CcdA
MRMGTKKAVNLTIDSDLLDQARKLGVNLSRELEARLEQLTKAERSAQWQQENREAIEAYNRRVEQRGLFSDRHRRF